MSRLDPSDSKTIIFLICALISSASAFAAGSLSETEQQNLSETVVNYLTSVVDKDNQIIIHDPENRDERKFQLKGLWNTVTESNAGKESIYSVPIDSDEIGMIKPNVGGHPWLKWTILYADAKKTQNSWEVIQIKIGPRNLRQTSEGHAYEEDYFYKFKK